MGTSESQWMFGFKRFAGAGAVGTPDPLLCPWIGALVQSGIVHGNEENICWQRLCRIVWDCLKLCSCFSLVRDFVQLSASQELMGAYECSYHRFNDTGQILGASYERVCLIQVHVTVRSEQKWKNPPTMQNRPNIRQDCFFDKRLRPW